MLYEDVTIVRRLLAICCSRFLICRAWRSGG